MSPCSPQTKPASLRDSQVTPVAFPSVKRSDASGRVSAHDVEQRPGESVLSPPSFHVAPAGVSSRDTLNGLGCRVDVVLSALDILSSLPSFGRELDGVQPRADTARRALLCRDPLALDRVGLQIGGVVGRSSHPVLGSSHAAGREVVGNGHCAFPPMC